MTVPDPGMVFVLPGQGSQAVGMGRELAAAYPAAAAVFQRAGEVVGWDVAGLCFEGPAEELSRTDRVQAALYTCSMAAAAALAGEGLAAAVTCGHSLGEYAALACAGAFDFETGLELVARRGEIMRRAAEGSPGAMAAILGLDAGVIEELCREQDGVWPVNYNCPGQLVVSGTREAVAAVMEQAESAGARKVVKLAVGGAFHTLLMQEAAAQMRRELDRVEYSERDPPFLSSISCRYEGAAGLAELLERQMVSPVRWQQAVEQLLGEGYRRFVEVGSGRVLSGLIRRTSRDARVAAAGDPRGIDKALSLD